MKKYLFERPITKAEIIFGILAGILGIIMFSNIAFATNSVTGTGTDTLNVYLDTPAYINLVSVTNDQIVIGDYGENLRTNATFSYQTDIINHGNDWALPFEIIISPISCIGDVVRCLSTDEGIGGESGIILISNITSMNSVWSFTEIGDQIPPPETCSDGIQNQDEIGIDTGGVCILIDTDNMDLFTQFVEFLSFASLTGIVFGLLVALFYRRL